MNPPDLPPAPEWTDLPDWTHNFDNVRVRAVNTAWNLLLTRDVSAISFRDLTKPMGVTPAAMYHHFPTLTDLAKELATAATAKLSAEIIAASAKGRKPLHAFRAFLQFARKRPHHFALVTTPRFNEAKGVTYFRGRVDESLGTLLDNFLRRAPRTEEQLQLRLQLFGGATLVALGAATVSEVLVTLTRTLTAWRKAARKKR